MRAVSSAGTFCQAHSALAELHTWEASTHQSLKTVLEHGGDIMSFNIRGTEALGPTDKNCTEIIRSQSSVKKLLHLPPWSIRSWLLQQGWAARYHYYNSALTSKGMRTKWVWSIFTAYKGAMVNLQWNQEGEYRLFQCGRGYRGWSCLNTLRKSPNCFLCQEM